jgi:two-component system, NtrC family, response regulator
VAVLARALLDKFAHRHKRALRGFSPDAIQAIQTYSWPGNVRELENKINGAVILAEGSQVTAKDLDLGAGSVEPLAVNLRQVRDRAERQAIQRALSVDSGNISKAAELLGISRPTLYDLMSKHALK